MEQQAGEGAQATRGLLVVLAIGRSLRALLVAIGSRRNFEFTVDVSLAHV